MFPFYDKTLISVVTFSKLLNAEWPALIGKEKCHQATTMEAREGVSGDEEREREEGGQSWLPSEVEIIMGKETDSCLAEALGA